jgi:hypothetical protein
MSRKMTKKEKEILEILKKELKPFHDKYPPAWINWELGGLNEKENDFSMGISVQPFGFDENITKEKRKSAEKIIDDELLTNCFLSFMNELNNSSLLDNIKKEKDDKLQLDVWNIDLPWCVEFGIYIGNDEDVIHSVYFTK